VGCSRANAFVPNDAPPAISRASADAVDTRPLFASLPRMTRLARFAPTLLISWLLLSDTAAASASSPLAGNDTTANTAAVPVSPADATVFDYDRAAPLDLQQTGESSLRDGALVTDFTFASRERRVRAYLVSPADGPAGNYAGVLYVHWLGDRMTTNRTEFLDEAVALASQGIVSLLVEAMWAAPKWYADRVPENDYEQAIQQVIDLRRALDVLLAEPRVDPARIAYVGHDFGAMYGIVMGAIDPRPTTYVLMAGAPRFIDWMLFARQPEDPAAYRAQLSTLDPLHFVERLAPAPVFFQFAATDEYVSAESAAALYAAAQPRKQMTTYASGDGLQTPEAAADRITWLVRELARK
jgi:dienelactone hydrolase